MDNQQRNNNPRFTENDISTIIELYNSGKSQQKIGKLYNCGASIVRYYLIKNNIPLRKSKKKSFT